MFYCYEYKTNICKLFIICSDSFIEEIDISQKDISLTKYIKYKNDRFKSSNNKYINKTNDEILSNHKYNYCKLTHYNESSGLSYLKELLSLFNNYFSKKPTDFSRVPVNLNYYSHHFPGMNVNVKDFSNIPVNLNYYSNFAKKILLKTRDISYGSTISYCELASVSGLNKRFARAVASVLASNKTPIVIPCHRVIMSNGKIGGYSSGQGTALKVKLLSLENFNHSFYASH